jgi:predicted XRE-type DNA-binding protein
LILFAIKEQMEIYTEDELRILIKAKVEKSRLSQNGFARKLGLSKGHWSEFLAGKKGLGEKTVAALGYQTVYIKKGKA